MNWEWSLFRLGLCAVGFVAAVLASQRWQSAVFGLILWETFRDPIRKVVPSLQVDLVFFGFSIWIGVFFGWFRHYASPDVVRHLTWQVSPAVVGLLIFLTCATGTALLSAVPWPVIALGLVSYIFPWIGYPIGQSFWQHQESGRQLFWLFCLVNGIFIGTAILEVLGVRSPMLGGIMMEWYRFRGDINIPLPSGLYRSPDILGLHAAHVAAVAWLLFWNASHQKQRGISISICLYAIVILVFSARRKMLGLFLIFVLVWILEQMAFLRDRGWTTLFRWALRGCVSVAITLFATHLLLPDQTEYAFSLLTEFPARIWTSTISSPSTTFAQTGWWGTGLGTATQGNSVLNQTHPFGWQEDGLGRLLREGGILPAAGLIVGFMISVVRMGLFSCPRGDAESSRHSLRQGLPAILIGNLVCFMISHQHVSGDPYFGAFLMFLAGGAGRTSRTIGHV